MSGIKQFTGSNLKGKKSGSGLTAPTYFWMPETAPLNNQDGMDIKNMNAISKFVRATTGYHSTAAANHTKTRGAACVGKYKLHKLVRFRKTMKKLATAAGFAVGGAIGERNMFTNKGNGNTGDTAKPKNNQQTPLADSYEVYPIDAGK